VLWTRNGRKYPASIKQSLCCERPGQVTGTPVQQISECWQGRLWVKRMALRWLLE